MSLSLVVKRRVNLSNRGILVIQPARLVSKHLFEQISRQVGADTVEEQARIRAYPLKTVSLRVSSSAAVSKPMKIPRFASASLSPIWRTER